MDTKSYLMGIFDGEGCVGTGKNARGQWYVQASVTMANADEVMALFVETWGGGLSRPSALTAGGLQLITWHINSSKGIPFLEYAAEHSKVKRRQAEIALAMARNVAKYNQPGMRVGYKLSKGESFIRPEDAAEREALVMQIRALNGARSRYT